MPIRLNGSTSGYVELAAPAVADNSTVDVGELTASGLVPVAPTSVEIATGSGSLSGYTTTFSGATSVSLNGVFSSDYLSYRIVVTGLSAASSADFNMRLRASGSDNTASSYRYGRVFCGLLDATALSSSVNITTNVFRMAYVGTTQSGVSIDVYSPMVTGRTTATAVSASQYSMSFGGIFNNTNNFDGLTFSGGTFSGRMVVYAYKGSQ